jgi:hypothetical protein
LTSLPDQLPSPYPETCPGNSNHIRDTNPLGFLADLAVVGPKDADEIGHARPIRVISAIGRLRN